MSGKTGELSTLAARKQSLVLESERNRRLLLAEWDGCRQQMQVLTRGLEPNGSLSLLPMALKAAAACWEFCQGFSPRDPAPTTAKSSWLPSLWRGVRLGAGIWSVLHSRRR